MKLRMIRTGLLTFFAMVALVNPPARLRAQSTFGSVRGIAQDQTGAAIADAKITLHSVDENSDVSTVSGPAGDFLFENVKAGHFRLTAMKPGFANVVIDNVSLAGRQEVRLDVNFDLAATTQEVLVTAQTVAVNTENATLTDSKVSSEFSQLPLNSRTVSTSPLSALAVSPDVTKDSQGNIAIGGATSAQTGFAVDGISTANVRLNGSLQDAYPSLEGISQMSSHRLQQQRRVRADCRRYFRHEKRNE